MQMIRKNENLVAVRERERERERELHFNKKIINNINLTRLTL